MTKEIRKTIKNISTIAYNQDSLKNKSQFSVENMAKVPQTRFMYLIQVFKYTAFRVSQYENTIQADITKISLKTCSVFETDKYERCKEQVKDFKHLLWDFRYTAASRKKWKNKLHKDMNKKFR
jgi:hypothetical protein